MLCGVQVHLLRVGTLGWFLESAYISFILILERGSLSSMFHLSLIYMIINAYSDLNHVSQLIRSIASNDLILYIVLKTSIKGVH
jgi:hypothetical protein